ncbi:BMP family ABC transporter substrate-binding protein [bacterium]|nr:BMP family ABC transporter substrate-binding protein [candidate division CSSED10-310 bacterium]
MGGGGDYVNGTVVRAILVGMLAAACNGCGGGGIEETSNPQGKVGLVTDVGKVDDKTFNQSAYEGMMRAVSELGLHGAFIETTQPTDYEKNIQQFIDDGFGLIVTVGFMLGDATRTLALAHPEVSFAIVDFAYEPPLPNVRGMVFAEEQSGFLGGALAALMSKSKKIGFVGGKEIPPVVKFRLGYEAGARLVSPDCRVLSVYIDSFTDPARGKAAAESQIAEGADVLFGCGGTTGSGAVKAANDQGVFCIGVDQDEYLTTFSGGPAPYLLTSAMKRVDNAVYQAVKDYATGVFSAGTQVGVAANQGIDLAPFHDTETLIPLEVKARLAEIKAGLADGGIATGVAL